MEFGQNRNSECPTEANFLCKNVKFVLIDSVNNVKVRAVMQVC
jgi:hypothetical protein